MGINETLAAYVIPSHAVKQLRIPQKSLYLAIADGRIPSRKLGCGQTVIRLADVEKWNQKRAHGRGRTCTDGTRRG